MKGDSIMTRSSLGTYSLFPAILLWAVLLGGIVYSHIVFFPVYLSALPDSAVVVNGTYGLNEARFWMLVHPLLIISLIVAIALNWKFNKRRKLILISSAVYAAVLLVSGLFFVPELIAFARSPQSDASPAEWMTRANRWQYLSWVRGTICLLSFLPLLIALTKAEAVGSKEEETATVYVPFGT
jgi:hypothetical protein